MATACGPTDLWGWGFNANAELGDGTTEQRNEADRARQPAGVAHARCGKRPHRRRGHTGSALGLGRQLVRRARHRRHRRPVDPDAGRHRRRLAHGHGGLRLHRRHKEDGTLWAWGLNGIGRLGDGTTTDRLVPTRIGSDADWLLVVGGESHTLASKVDGIAVDMGLERVRSARHGRHRSAATFPRRSRPTSGPRPPAYGHSIALKADGTLWAWGMNDQGQVGDGTRTNRMEPTLVSDEPGWRSVVAGRFHNVGLRADGSLRTWGDSEYGALGHRGDRRRARTGRGPYGRYLALGGRRRVPLHGHPQRRHALGLGIELDGPARGRDHAGPSGADTDRFVHGLAGPAGWREPHLALRAQPPG